STMFVLSGSTLSIGLAFLIMSHTMPLNYIESIFLGTTETITKDNFKSNNVNNTNNQNQILNRNHSDVKITITLPHSTTIINNFLSSLHYIFVLSAILMLISIIPSCISVGNDRNNNHKINNN
ncbi:MAG: hypothetical protein WBE68_00610, partial [Candidatus Nitrosopolaris sp.]